MTVADIQFLCSRQLSIKILFRQFNVWGSLFDIAFEWTRDLVGGGLQGESLEFNGN